MGETGILYEIRCRLFVMWRRLAFRVRVHWHAVELADALHELEDETACYVRSQRRGDMRAQSVVDRAQRVLAASGRGVKGWN